MRGRSVASASADTDTASSGPSAARHRIRPQECGIVPSHPHADRHVPQLREGGMTEEAPEGILSPSDLGPDDEHVRQLDDGRHVVVTDETGSRPATDGGTAPVDGPTQSAASEGSLADLDGAYAMQTVARAGTSEGSHSIETSDVSEAFESLLRWYAEQVSDGTPPADVIAVLLSNTDLDVEARVR